jgi:hypothetical protein
MRLGVVLDPPGTRFPSPPHAFFSRAFLGHPDFTGPEPKFPMPPPLLGRTSGTRIEMLTIHDINPNTEFRENERVVDMEIQERVSFNKRVLAAKIKIPISKAMVRITDIFFFDQDIYASSSGQGENE